MKYDKRIAEHIGRRVAELRKSHSLSLRAFANEIGLCYVTIFRIERGEYFPTILTALMIADYFGVTLDELIRPKE